MALLKKTTQGALVPHGTSRSDTASAREAEAQRKRARTLAKQQQAAERIAAATAQLASGITEASSAVEELKRASDQIAAGAQEASGASQECLSAFKQVAQTVNKQMQNAHASKNRVESAQALVAKVTTEILGLVKNVGVAAERQENSVKMVKELEQQASNIGDIVKAVGRIADQTNLLALNAAIEAARAGKHGKGFAVVADEVRTLAETSEKSAKQIQDLVAQIQQEVNIIASGINKSATDIKGELEKGNVINSRLDQIKKDMIDILKGAQEIATAAEQSNIATQQALKGVEQIAAAAEEQSAAAEESAKTVSEQAQALSECEQSAQNLSELAEDLKNSTDIAKSAEEVASAAEQLSSAIQQINRSSTQISAALEQIRKGTQTQAAATEESSSALAQIEKGIEVSAQKSKMAYEKLEAMDEALATNKKDVNELIEGINNSVTVSKNILQQVKDLEMVSRRIDKIVDAITTVSIQTNMLAVNGAIEAARAGEFGKGFAVVATDIRNLAHDSAGNAEKIKDMVKAVQDQISIVSNDIQDIMASAVSEAEKAKTTTEAMISIEGEIKAVKDGANEILNMANELVTSVGEIKKAIEQIAAAAQEADKASTEAAAAAKEQSQAAEELAAATEEIASLADELQSA